MVFNFDETEVGGKHGKLIKAFVSADTLFGGYNMGFKKSGKLLTAFVISSAAGKVLPPFFIFERKTNMNRWYDLLPQEI